MRCLVRAGNERAWQRGQRLLDWLPPLGWAAAGAEVAHTYLVVWPLAVLYLKGPSVHGYGMWGGAAPQDICIRTGAMRLADWSALGAGAADARCMDELRRRLDALVVAFWFVVSLLLLYKLVCEPWRSWMTASAALCRHAALAVARAVTSTKETLGAQRATPSSGHQGTM